MERIMLIKIEKVMEMLGVKKTAIYRMVSDGVLAAPIKVGGASRWVLEEVNDSIAAMVYRRNNPESKIKRRGRPPRLINNQTIKRGEEI
jgi:predicted DNA-binding transcriptional regulator AlpA